MKNIFLLLILISTVTNFYSEDLKRIAVLNISIKGYGLEKDLAQTFEEVVINSLLSTNNFKVIERKQLNLALNELKLQNQDYFDESKAIDIGNFVGAQLVLFGTISKLDENYYMIDIRVVNVETSEIVYALGDTATSLSQILDKADILAKNINNSEFRDSSKKMRMSSKYFYDKNFVEKWNLTDFKADFNEINKKHSVFNGSFIGLGAFMGSSLLLGGIFMASYGGVLNYQESLPHPYDYSLDDPLRKKVEDNYYLYGRTWTAFLIMGISMLSLSVISVPIFIVLGYFKYQIEEIFFNKTGSKISQFLKKTSLNLLFDSENQFCLSLAIKM